ncbi:20154_t:CDS:10, partial [Cetraspora pellucida]
YHQKHCSGLGEATQEVKLPTKDIKIKFKCLENKASWLNNKLKNTSINSEDYKTLTKQIDKITKDINQEKFIDIKKTPIPVVFHNFWGYDSHLVCESIGKSVNANQIKFMNSSLASLTKNLGDNHPITSKHFKKLGYTKDQLDLVYRKGVYPYDYIDSQDRFLETELPPIHEFSTYLHGKISQKDYEHAQKVWKEFNCKTLGEYHDIYLKTDVLSLADVWTQLRKMSMEYDGLDPSHYVSLPAYSWNAMLKITEVKIELFTDMAMHDFIEKAKRRGIAMACKRYFKAKNPKIGKAFNPSKPTTWILYELSCKYLEDNPSEQKKYLEKILNTKADAKRGYFLNIKMHFFLKTHDYLNDLPPAVENMAVNKNMLCPYTTELVDNLDSRRFSATEKLVPHLGLRKDYVIHYQELQYYVKLGMIVDEVTEILSFDQDNWLVPYIAFNTEKRNEAKKAENTFLSDFFKLKNNAVYGKTMENVHKYQDVKLMAINNEQDKKKFINQIHKPLFKYARQLGSSLIGAYIGKASITLNKSIIVGASVLCLSKLHMYRFWYGYIKERYGNNAQLGYKDTDSYLFQVETEDIYKDMEDATTIGKFKNETPDSVITESYHIQAKSYHHALADKSTKSKHKGVSKKGINEMAMNLYMTALEGSLLDNPIDKSLLSEQEAMRTEADPMTLVYRDCLFGNKVFYAKNIAYKNFVSNRISPELAEQRALSIKLSKKYQNESAEWNQLTIRKKNPLSEREAKAETKSQSSAFSVLYTNIAPLYSEEEVNARIKEATDNLCQEFIKSTEETLKTIKQQKDIECNQIKIDMANWKEKDSKSYSNNGVGA